ncbi:MAG: HAMP domain-containing sensor histidine kinase [bacterium]|nr:HAMP domain-containing sensor histidine kinase [bacterium]
MGIINIAGMIGTSFVAQRFSEDPSVIVLSVSMMTVFLFVVGNSVVSSFQRLADVSRMKSEFVNIVSHQLRSPLSAIKWQLEIMLERVKTLTGEAAETIGTIRDQNERMIALVNDLLEVSRIEDDRLILRSIYINMDDFLGRIVKEYDPLAKQKGLSMKFDTKDERPWVFADESKLRWITENLIDNATRYTKEGVVTIRVQKEKGHVRVEIEDSGIGIPIMDQGRIFTKFFRSDTAVRLRAEGTGLGLYLVKSLVEAMSGEVGFASLEGKGSTFWFLLPLVRKGTETSNTNDNNEPKKNI